MSSVVRLDMGAATGVAAPFFIAVAQGFGFECNVMTTSRFL